MKKLKLRPFVLPSIYLVLVVSLLLGALYSYNIATTDNSYEEDLTYVSGVIFSNDTPVVSTGKVIIKPYKSEDVKIAKYFYEKDEKESKQKESIVYYGNTYIQNSGMDYISDKEYDVVAILDGTVSSVKEDELLGKTVEIKHENKLVSVYQGVENISVKEGDSISQGQSIAKSGESTLNDVTGKHLHFELIYNGQLVNPETYYDKNVNEL